MECKWIVEEIEHERGWGQRCDGYWIFENQADAEAQVKRWYAEMPAGPAPDCYSSYNHVGWKPLGPKTVEAYNTSARQGYTLKFADRYMD